MKNLQIMVAGAGAALVLLSGCTHCQEAYQWCKTTWKKSPMALEEPQPSKTQSVIDAHKQEVNREAELKLLCDKAWVPVYICGQEGVDGKNAIVLPPELEAYLLFTRDGKVNGFAGVSAFTGSFAVSAPNLLRIGALSTSMKAGTHLDYEMLFMAQLNEVNKFVILPDGNLEMKNRDSVMLRCKPVAIADLKHPPKKDAAEAAKEAKPVTLAPAAKTAPAAAAASAEKPAAAKNK